MTDYLDQVRHQLDATRAHLRSAEDELAVHRQRASREDRLRTAWRSARRRASRQHAIVTSYRTEHLAATTYQVAAGTPLICSDERHATKVAALEGRRDELANALREVLATFVHKVHPGYAALQSQMIEVEAVDRWRLVLAQPAPRPPEPTGRPDASSITDTQLDALYAELDRLREGEADSDDDPAVTSPALFIRRWNRATAAERLRVAQRLQEALERGDRCFLTNHEQQLAEIRWQHTGATALMAQVQQLGGQLKEAEAERDGAYRERAQLVAWLAAGHPAVLTPAPDVDEPGWQIIYLDANGQQLSWHIHPRDAELFRHVEQVPAGDPRAKWDGHTTAEKYKRIRALADRSPIVDTCHTVTVDGETIRVRGAGPLGTVGEIALAEVMRAAKRRYIAEHPVNADPAPLPADAGNAEDCPACSERRDLPYPFLCPGHPAATPSTSN